MAGSVPGGGGRASWRRWSCRRCVRRRVRRTAGWVQERLGGDLAYTTVITILTRLLAKGAVARERAGRSFSWTSASDEAGLAAHRMRRVLDAESDREAVLASFVTGLGPDDERLLRELLGRPRPEREHEGSGDDGDDGQRED